MSSASVTKAVAKKLKYYLDVRRREDGFDLSGPFHPKEDPVPLRAGPTLDYDGIHDRSLKHYFHNNNVKKQLQKMYTVQGQDSRERSVRGFVDQTMASVDYRLRPGPISPYALPQTVPPKPPPHRPQARMSVDDYLKTKKGSKRRKFPSNVVGKPRRILRRSPPQHVCPNERERLVNMATKLIVATETVALPGMKKQSKGLQASEKELPHLQREKQRSRGAESVSSDSEGYQKRRRHPAPPRVKPRSAPSRRPESSFFKSSEGNRGRNQQNRSGVHVVLPGESGSDDDERLRSLIDRMNLDGRGSVVASPHQASDSRPKGAGHALKSSAVGPDEELSADDYNDDDDFESDYSPRLSSTRVKPRLSWIEKEHDMIDMSTQTVVHSGTQTDKELEEIKEPIEKQVILPLRLSPIKRNSLDEVREVTVATETATLGASTSDIPTSTPLSTETQTRDRDLEPKVLTYEVYVLTGDKLGAGTKAVVKFTLFGEYGNSGERQLLCSKTHRTKFQRGQVDIFAVDSFFLGKLSSLRIGHSETKLGYGWFLEKVFVKEGPEATRAFEFNCGRWLSSRDDDGQIIRDLPATDVIPVSHVVAILPRIDQRDDDFFGSGSESESFSSDEEENVPSPELREVKRKPKSKVKALREDITAVTTIPPSAAPQEGNEEKGLVAVKAENLFDISEGEEDDEGKEEENSEKEGDEVEAKNKGEESGSGRFFQPEEDGESDKSEDESTEANKPGKKWKEEEEEEEKSTGSEEEDNDEAEEQGQEDGGAAGDTQKAARNGSDHLRLVSTAVSQFLQQPNDQKTTPKPKTSPPRETVAETEEIQDNEKQNEGDESRVEFTGDEKPEGERERPVSAQSDDFVEGFKAGIRAKHERDRERHKESISESETIFRKGSSIHDAAKAGDLDRIKELIHVAPAMKNATDERGMNPLHIAAANGRLDCVKWLAVSGVDLAEETPTGYTAMHLAAMNGHVNCMMILSAMGSTLSCRTVDELTPLHLAAMSGFIECVKWLIANRANVEVEDSNGRTPLDIAEEYGHEEIVKFMKKFKRELTRQDSTLAQLMTSERKRRKSVESLGSDQEGVPSKVSDSGVGGLESGEDSWISDTEEDVTMEGAKNSRPGSQSRQRPDSGKERPLSASRARTDSITSIEDRKVNYEKQRSKMMKRNSSFLDSIRMEVDYEEEF